MKRETMQIETARLHRISATCHPENHASERVLQKIGMQKEGYLREHKWSKGMWHDSLLSAMSERDWKAVPGTASPIHHGNA
jgi:[ribosomal protein S5]-alanine N-acetyltransferase